jgi:hypothetical protein
MVTRRTELGAAFGVEFREHADGSESYRAIKLLRKR